MCVNDFKIKLFESHKTDCCFYMITLKTYGNSKHTRVAILSKFSFPLTYNVLPSSQFVSRNKNSKCNIDNSYPLIKYGNEMWDVNIF